MRMVRAGEARAGMVIAARCQTAGRGRYDRKWLAAAGQNLTFSFYLPTQRGFPEIASIPVAAALGVLHYLRQRHDLPAAGKWPNDVMIGPRKICGILSERVERTLAQPANDLPAPSSTNAAGAAGAAGATGTSCAGDSTPAACPCALASAASNHIVVGIGVNLNMTADDATAVPKPATSVFIETGRKTEPEEELPLLISHLERWLARWEEGGFPALREAWTERAWRLGETVTIGDGAYRQTGILHGFGESGELLLRLPDGAIRPCWAGDFEY